MTPMQALAIHLRTLPPGSGNEEGRHLGGVRFCLTPFILVILDWRAGNLAINRARVPIQTFRRARRSTTADTFTNPSPTAQPVPGYLLHQPILAPPQPAVNRFSAADSTTNHTLAYSIAPTTTTIAPTTSMTCPATRLSMDVYDQSSDPGPSGFGSVLSTTYQYADLYAVVRVSLATSTTAPPSDEPYTGYR
ncbi:hypothetical protein M405DRAFT_881963 [Rhizopogon salebrosus TDB-379]|nr:hypothetical protein M405DRAFT_881963 [Rhizopogon salebrosus TDB-379]